MLLFPACCRLCFPASSLQARSAESQRRGFLDWFSSRPRDSTVAAVSESVGTASAVPIVDERGATGVSAAVAEGKASVGLVEVPRASAASDRFGRPSVRASLIPPNRSSSEVQDMEVADRTTVTAVDKKGKWW
jgi:hypothetical protein